MSLISWHKVVTGYDGEALHEAFTGHMEEPGIYAIIGPNGSGKTSFLRASLGLIQPISGHIRLGDQGLSGPNTPFSPPFPLSYVPQSQQINPYYPVSVKQLVMLPPNAKPDLVKQLLEDWDLSGIQHKNFRELSMGQKMRTLIVRALGTCPKLLFLDEPLSSLDFHCQKLLVDQLQVFKEAHGTLSLVIDHHMARFSQMLDGFLVFERCHNHRLTHLYFSQENPEESLNGTVK